MSRYREGMAMSPSGAAAERSDGDPAAAGLTARSGAAAPDGGPDPEVVARPRRRSFTADYKQRILREADAAKARGELGALLRREGLYSSALTAWRRERETAAQGAFSRPRGPKPKHSPESAELEKLRRRNQHLEEELRKAQIVIEVQKKVARLLRLPASGTKSKDH